MPEGHTVHRLARQHRKALAGQTIITTSPQGRFSTGAKRLNGQELKRVDAHGKHLFYRWAGGEILHIHLGLFGKFRLHNTKPAPAPTPNTRLTMTGDEATVYLAGPTVCELVDPPEEESIRRRLGPAPSRFWGAEADSIHRQPRPQANTHRRHPSRSASDRGARKHLPRRNAVQNRDRSTAACQPAVRHRRRSPMVGRHHPPSTRQTRRSNHHRRPRRRWCTAPQRSGSDPAALCVQTGRGAVSAVRHVGLRGGDGRPRHLVVHLLPTERRRVPGFLADGQWETSGDGYCRGCSRNHSTVAGMASSSGVAWIPKVDSKVLESTTYGSSNS